MVTTKQHKTFNCKENDGRSEFNYDIRTFINCHNVPPVQQFKEVFNCTLYMGETYGI
jgi:hypothetical protein